LIKSQSGNHSLHAHSHNHKLDYNKDLRLDRMFDNPYGLQQMRLALDIISIGSFVADHENYPASDYYDEIRLQQNRNWAQKEVEAGIKLAKQGLFKEAMNKYQTALDADPENTDAMVAKGAAFFNVNMISDAIASFERALDIQPRHQNAKKYLDIALKAQQVSKKSVLGNSEHQQQEDKQDLSSEFDSESITKKLKTMLKEEKSKNNKDKKSKKDHAKKHKKKKKRKTSTRIRKKKAKASS